MNEQNLKALYNATAGRFDNLGSYDEFKNRMQNKTNRDAFFNAASGMFGNLGDRDEFESRLGFNTPEPTPAPETAQVATPKPAQTSGTAGAPKPTPTPASTAPRMAAPKAPSATVDIQANSVVADNRQEQGQSRTSIQDWMARLSQPRRSTDLDNLTFEDMQPQNAAPSDMVDNLVGQRARTTEAASTETRRYFDAMPETFEDAMAQWDRNGRVGHIPMDRITWQAQRDAQNRYIAELDKSEADLQNILNENNNRLDEIRKKYLARRTALSNELGISDSYVGDISGDKLASMMELDINGDRYASPLKPHALLDPELAKLRTEYQALQNVNDIIPRQVQANRHESQGLKNGSLNYINKDGRFDPERKQFNFERFLRSTFSNIDLDDLSQGGLTSMQEALDKFVSKDDQETLKGLYRVGQIEQAVTSPEEKYGQGTALSMMMMADFLQMKGPSSFIKGGMNFTNKTASKYIAQQAIDAMADQGFKYLFKNGWRGAKDFSVNYGLKFLGATADDITRSAAMIAGVQTSELTADIINTKLGGIVQGDGGELKYDNNHSWGSAIWQSTADRLVENLSEMSGERVESFFGLVGRALKGSKADLWLEKINRSSFGTIWNNVNQLLDKTGVQDIFGELTEEFIGQLDRTILNLESAYRPKLDEEGNPVYDKDGNPVMINNFADPEFYSETATALALSIGMMKATAAPIAVAQYAQQKRALNKSDASAAAMFESEDEWNTLRSVIDNTKNGDMADMLKTIREDQTLNPLQKLAVENYIFQLGAMRGINIAGMHRPMSDVESIITQALLQGSRERNPEQKKATYAWYQDAMKEAQQLVPNELAELDANPVAELQRMRDNGSYTPQQIDAALNYVNAKARRDGIQQQNTEDTEVRIARETATIKANTHRDTGRLERVALDGDVSAHVVSGTVALNEDGSYNPANSSSSLIVRTENGEIKFVGPNEIKSAEAPVDAAQAAESATQMIREEEELRILNETSSQLTMKNGEKFNGIAPGNNVVEYTVVGMNNDGTVVVDATINGQTQRTAMSPMQLQSQHDAYIAERAAELRANQSQRQQPANQAPAEQQAQPVAGQQQAPADFQSGDIVELGEDAKDRGVVAEVEDGKVYVYFNERPEGEKMEEYTPEQLAAAARRHDTSTRQAVPQQAPAVEQPVTEQPVAQVQTEAPVEVQAPVAEQAAVPAAVEEQQPATAMSRVPLNEQGQPQFTEADPQTAWDALVEKIGNPVDAKEYADNMVAVSQRRLAEAQNRKVEASEDLEQFAAEKAQQRAEIAKAQADLDAWTAIANVEAQRQAEVQAEVQAQAQAQAQARAQEQAQQVTAEQQPEAPNEQQRDNQSKTEVEKVVEKLQERFGTPIDLCHTPEEIPDEFAAARSVINKVLGAYNTKTGRVFLYAPNLDRAKAERTFIHEVIAHKGLSELLGKEAYDKFCLEVYNNVMNEAEREKYLKYPGVNGRPEVAADEYIAHHSEAVENLSEGELTAWDKIVATLRRWLKNMGLRSLSKEDVEYALRRSAERMKTQARHAQAIEHAQQTKNGVVFNDKGEIDAVNIGGTMRYNIATYEESGREKLVAYLQKKVKEKVFTRAEVDNLLESIDALAAQAKELAEGNPDSLFGQWSVEEVRTVDGTSIALRHAMKANAEYSLNIDFSTVCKKRQAIDNIMNQLINRGHLQHENLSATDIARFNQIIQKHGLEIACGICFIDSRRYNASVFAQGFLNKFNPIVQSLEPNQKIAGYNYANNTKFSNEGKRDLSQSTEVLDIDAVVKPDGTVNKKALAGYELNWDYILNILTRDRVKSKDKSPRPSIIQAAREEYRQRQEAREAQREFVGSTERALERYNRRQAAYKAATEEYNARLAEYNKLSDEEKKLSIAPTKPKKPADKKPTELKGLLAPKSLLECIYSECSSAEEKMAFFISQNPELRKLAKAEDFIASQGWENVREHNELLEKLWNIQKGAAGAKPNEGNAQYLSDVLEKTVNGDIFDIAGYRMQSFSDFIGRMFFDYAQAFADLAARKLPGHAYTKEPSFVKIFGLMGMKINMSLVSDVDTKVVEKYGRDYAGLTEDADGNLVYIFYETVRGEDGSIIIQGQTFPAKEAFKLQADPLYSKNVGTIAVGLSREHIRMMLRDPRIRMVIPYHKSGLPHGVAIIYRMTEINDYTRSQNTRVKGGAVEYYDETGKKVKSAGFDVSDDAKKLMHKRVDHFNFIVHTLATAEDRSAAYDALRHIIVFSDASKYKKLKKDKVGPMRKEFERVYNAIRSGKITDNLSHREISDRFDSRDFLPAAAADIYKEACERWGYIPKFDEFANEQGYYKVLTDFAQYDHEGNFAPQEIIKFQLPENVGEYIAETLAEDEAINQKMNDEYEGIAAEMIDYLGNTELREEQDRIASKKSADVTEAEKEWLSQPLYNVGDPRNGAQAREINKQADKAQTQDEPRFSVIGEQGAAELDRSEEATTRLDNLGVAREDQIFLMNEGGKSNKQQEEDELRFSIGETKRIGFERSIKFTRVNPTTTFNAFEKYVKNIGVPFVSDVARTGSKYLKTLVNGVYIEARFANHTKSNADETVGGIDYSMDKNGKINGIYIDTSIADAMDFKATDFKELVDNIRKGNFNGLIAERIQEVVDRETEQEREADQRKQTSEFEWSYVDKNPMPKAEELGEFVASNGIIFNANGTAIGPNGEKIDIKSADYKQARYERRQAIEALKEKYDEAYRNWRTGYRQAFDEFTPTESNIESPILEFSDAPRSEWIDAIPPGNDILKRDARLKQEQQAGDEPRFSVAEKENPLMDIHSPLSARVLTARINFMAQHMNNVDARNEAMQKVTQTLSGIRRAIRARKLYDQNTVELLSKVAQTMLGNHLLEGSTPHEINRIVSVIRNNATKENIAGAIDKMFEIMSTGYLRQAENEFKKMLKVKGSKVDAKGVEVQGRLDVQGQRILKHFKDLYDPKKRATLQTISDRANVIQNALSNDRISDVQRAEYIDELTALNIYSQYLATVDALEKERDELEKELTGLETKYRDGDIDSKQRRELEQSIRQSITENRLEAAEAYQELMKKLGGELSESVARARDFTQAQQDHAREIQHNANSDMQHIDAANFNRESPIQKLANNGIVRFLLKPLATFEQMFRVFGSRNANGEGYLYNRFVRGWVKASENEYLGYKAATDRLDKKVSEIFGRGVKHASDLYAMTRVADGTITATVSTDAGPREYKLTVGNALYVYMVDKMSDGRMKLANMGISEDDVEALKEQLDPRLIELADWIQGEFLVKLRDKYNKVHERMFGAPMSNIDNYFPLKINERSRVKEVELTSNDDQAVASTITSSVIKRVRNTTAIDITGTDAIDVIVEHLQNMEHWAAFAEFNRDLKTLLSYKRFESRVKNMATIYGGGNLLWNNFKDVCAAAVGEYRPTVHKDSIDKLVTNVGKGVAIAKISMRAYTAFKQLLSFPAYLVDATPIELTKSLANPIGCWNWCMKNLPLFQERWQTRQAGDTRLKETDADWRYWSNKYVETLNRIGMSPNAFVDALTVAMGARAIYNTKYSKYIKEGYNEREADIRAKQDCTIAFNLTQQSSKGAFVSTMQLDRTLASTMLTLYRNSPMSYQRQATEALRSLKRKAFEKDYRENSINFMTKQILRDGVGENMTEAEAEAFAREVAKRRYNRSTIRDIGRVAVFAYLLQFAWNMMPKLFYVMFGDDDDEKQKIVEDAAIQSLFGGVEGLTGGSVMSDIGNRLATGGDFSTFDPELYPLFADIQRVISTLNRNEVAGATELANLLIQMGAGVNPQTITDGIIAITDAAGGNLDTSTEAAIAAMRLLQFPQSAIDGFLFDEIDMSAEDAQKLSPIELAQRYAEYKTLRGAALTNWAYSDVERDLEVTRHRETFNRKIREYLDRQTDQELLEEYNALTEVAANAEPYFESFAKKKSGAQLGNGLTADEVRGAFDEFKGVEGWYEYLATQKVDNKVNEMTNYWLNNATQETRHKAIEAINTVRRTAIDAIKNHHAENTEE